MTFRIYTSTQKQLILIATSLAVFFAPCLGAMVNVALPTIGLEMGAGAHKLGWVTSGHLLSSVICMIPAARMSDIHGRRKIFLSGIAVIAMTSFLSPFAPTPEALIGIRICEGIGASFIYGSVIALLSDIFTGSERPKVIGLNMSAVFVGMSSGPVLGGLLVGAFGWRSVFYFIIPLAVLALIMSRHALPEEIIAEKGQPFDVGGLGLFVAMLLCLVLGLTSLPNLWAMGSMLLGLCIVPFFVRYERNRKVPLLRIQVFHHNPTFIRTNTAVLIAFAASYQVTFLMSLYLQSVLGLPAGIAGLLLIAQPLSQGVVSPVAGTMAARMDTRIPISAGMLLITLSMAMFAGLSTDTAILPIILYQVILGVGIGLFVAPDTDAVINSVRKSDYGTASGVFSTMRQMGQIVAMGISLCMIALFLGNTANITAETIPAFMQSMQITFWVCVALGIAGLLLSIFSSSLIL